jgi:starch synthase (maltosyl-transferring)
MGNRITHVFVGPTHAGTGTILSKKSNPLSRYVPPRYDATMEVNLKKNGRKRVVIQNVSPSVNNGVFPAKRVVGEEVRVTAEIFSDGHQKIDADLLILYPNHADWVRIPMIHLENDLWEAVYTSELTGNHKFTIEAWVDHFGTWQKDLIKKKEANQDLKIEFQIGVEQLQKLVPLANETEKSQLLSWINHLEGPDPGPVALDQTLSHFVRKFEIPYLTTRYDLELQVEFMRKRALYSSWYELFVRSCGKNKHGTFTDVIGHLPKIAGMGFDVLYLTPIHPIGKKFRKGKNNNTQSTENDLGSPWAIGSSEGGHDAIHPELGTVADFKKLVKETKIQGIEIALDLAFQCSPDHPYIKEHPEWFSWRPDNTVQYAENPPKKYEDIVPLNFETEEWFSLWKELLRVTLYWVNLGVQIFRVDNPHTKPFRFWWWLISEIKKVNPNVLFLSEAFTRPRIMEYLAKIGFDQSYTYFTWRTDKAEIIAYMQELAFTEMRDYFRPNFWPTTPDILPTQLHHGSKAAFEIRLVLAATLSSNYGIYGSAYEHLCNEPYDNEEYLNSEKYEIKSWPLYGPLSEFISRVNAIRRENQALQTTWNIEFFSIANDNLIVFGKYPNLIVAVNLDPKHTQSGFVEIPLEKFSINASDVFIAHDLMTGEKYRWQGPVNYIELNPNKIPCHILRLEKN